MVVLARPGERREWGSQGRSNPEKTREKVLTALVIAINKALIINYSMCSILFFFKKS